VAGRVEAVGSGVTRIRVGDEVYGDNLQLMGGFAEYAVAPEPALAHKPEELTFAEVSAIPQAAAIALRGTAGVAAGQRVLINGAGGGSGSFAIQLAKRAGAHVTGVDNAGKLDFMRSLGADHVIDYRSDDFTRPDEPYDLVLDLVAHRSAFACRRALAPGGRYWCVGGPVRTLLAIMTIGSIIGRLTRRRIGVLVVPQGPRYFTPLTDLAVAGDIGIHIDRTFGLDEVPEALRYVGEGLAHGKVVVTTGGVAASAPTATIRPEPGARASHSTTRAPAAEPAVGGGPSRGREVLREIARGVASVLQRPSIELLDHFREWMAGRGSP